MLPQEAEPWHRHPVHQMVPVACGVVAFPSQREIVFGQQEVVVEDAVVGVGGDEQGVVRRPKWAAPGRYLGAAALKFQEDPLQLKVLVSSYIHELAGRGGCVLPALHDNPLKVLVHPKSLNICPDLVIRHLINPGLVKVFAMVSAFLKGDLRTAEAWILPLVQPVHVGRDRVLQTPKKPLQDLCGFSEFPIFVPGPAKPPDNLAHINRAIPRPANQIMQIQGVDVIKYIFPC
mmetsp:Transcript_13332/g.17084  ORF Transcript_13332/g.17084 Transcript_13332/m.17084 type:complete len:232 (+) Transcript_13332:625-1320(+)